MIRYHKNLFGIVIDECNISTTLIYEDKSLIFIDYWMYFKGWNELVN